MSYIKTSLEKVLVHKKPRYITESFLNATLGESFIARLVMATKFLPEGAKLSERIFCIMHDLYKPATCLHCQIPLGKFDKYYGTVEEYFERFCSSSCMQSYQYNMRLLPKYIGNIDTSDVELRIKNESIHKLKLKPSFMVKVMVYLYNNNVNYSLLSSTEALHLIKNGHVDVPKCSCGNPLKYLTGGKYRTYCSNKCKGKSPEVAQAREKSCIDKYGVRNVFQSSSVKEKIKQTNTEKYGTDHYTKTQEYRDRLKSGDIPRPEIDYNLIKQKKELEKLLKMAQFQQEHHLSL